MRTAQILTMALLSIFVFEVAHAAGVEGSSMRIAQVAADQKSSTPEPQTSPAPEAYRPPKRTHPGPTMMGARAHRMQEKVAADISKAKAAGKDVTEAERHKTEGDQALADGHYRIAVNHYRSAEKALHAPKGGAPK